MKFSLFVLVTFFSFSAFAQNDDIPDYRSKKDFFARIIEKDIRGEIASFSMGGIDESVGKLPLKTLPITSLANDNITFSGNDIEVKITGVPFDKTKHKLGFYEEKNLVKIDNKPYFGDYGKVPRTAIGSVSVIIDRDTVAIPPAAYFDLYNPIFSFNDKGVQKTQNKVFLSNDGRRIYVYMLKRETGGSYEVTWVIQDKKYLRRVVDFGFLK
jgi:hypothetical protein